MNKLTKITVAALLAGTATIAAAQQNSAKAFADQFATLQSYSGSSASQLWSPAPKTFSSKSDDPATPLTENEMQARSDESGLYQADHGNVHPDKGPTFAQLNPHGLPFAYYQAESSNSGEWKMPASATTAYASTNGAAPVASATPAGTASIASK